MAPLRRDRLHRESAFTLMEMLVVLVLMGVLMGVAVSSLSELASPQNAAAMEVMSFLKRARAKAISSTRAYEVVALTSQRLISRYAATCASAEKTQDNLLTLSLPETASITNIAWTICFEARGISRSAVDIPIRDMENTKTVQVVLGGAVRVL